MVLGWGQAQPDLRSLPDKEKQLCHYEKFLIRDSSISHLNPKLWPL